jgi:hypothetical protein
MKVKEMSTRCFIDLLCRDLVARTLLGLLFLSLLGSSLSQARADELKLETWRTEDVWVWEHHLLPEFYQTPKSSPIEISPWVSTGIDKVLLEGFSTRHHAHALTAFVLQPRKICVNQLLRRSRVLHARGLGHDGFFMTPRYSKSSSLSHQKPKKPCSSYSKRFKIE